MDLFRITKSKYKKDLSGKGAELFGGRWNKQGMPALYTSKNRSLCVLEFLVHTPKSIAPKGQVILTIKIPAKLESEIVKIPKKALKKGWDTIQNEKWTEALGSKYFEEKNKLGIIVPSVIIPQEYNVVLNPLHKAYKLIKIRSQSSFPLDERLFK